jgi:hypothetical protein
MAEVAAEVPRLAQKSENQHPASPNLLHLDQPSPPVTSACVRGRVEVDAPEHGAVSQT